MLLILLSRGGCYTHSQTENVAHESPLLVYYDGAWGNAGARAAAILIAPSGIKLRYEARLHFTNETDKCTPDIAEYEVIFLGASQIESHRRANMRTPHRLQGSIRAHRKGMHSHRANTREILSSSPKVGELFQRVHGGVH
jgi:hypothetical protein